MPAADYKKLSDEELVHRFIHRQDQTAITFLFERYGHLVMGVCFKYLKDAEVTKDATQRIFIKLLDDLYRFEVPCFKSWLYQVTKNFCLTELRKAIPVENNAFVITDDIEAEDNWQRKIKQEHLYNNLNLLIHQMEEEQRKCIEMFYQQKMIYSEISDKTGFSVLEIRSFLQNGKRNLRIKMEALSDVRS